MILTAKIKIMAKASSEKINIYDITQKRVISALREILSDPDFGLSLRPGMIQKLKKSVQSKKDGKVKDIDEVLKKYGV